MIIVTEEDYEKALKRISDLLEAKPGTPEEAELIMLTDEVFHYEEEHYPMDWGGLR